MAKAMSKTNAMRILEREKIPYREHTYSHDDGAIDGISVAEKMGQDPGQVFKTLITRSSHGGIYVFVIPVAKELDLKAAARAAGVKSIAMIHVSEILEITGYIRGGCSPIGMKKLYPTSFDCACQNLETVIVSGGKIGYQIEVDPQDLIRLTRGSIAPLTKEGL